MKTARSIIELATEIERQSKSKRDFIVPTQAAQVDINGTQQIAFNGNVFGLTQEETSLGRGLGCWVRNCASRGPAVPAVGG